VVGKQDVAVRIRIRMWPKDRQTSGFVEENVGNPPVT